MKKFGWVITWVNEEFLDHSEVGTIGPRNLTATAEEIKAKGRQFKMFDDDGILYYEGYCLCDDDESLFMPLDNFGRPNAGCTEIHYKNDEGYYDIL